MFFHIDRHLSRQTELYSTNVGVCGERIQFGIDGHGGNSSRGKKNRSRDPALARSQWPSVFFVAGGARPLLGAGGGGAPWTVSTISKPRATSFFARAFAALKKQRSPCLS